MDLIEQRRSALRGKFYFRVGILLLSLLAMLVFSAYSYYFTNMSQTLIFGIICSLFAWAFVAAWDLIISVYVTYVYERLSFLRELSNRLQEMTSELKSLKEDIEIDPHGDEYENILRGKNRTLYYRLLQTWINIREGFFPINKYIFTLPMKCKIYCLSKEYQDITNYLMRCFWLLQACIPNDDNLEAEKLFKKFIKIEENEFENDVPDTLEYMDFIMNGINKIYRQMQEIELNEKPYEPSKKLFSEYRGGILGEYSNTPVQGIKIKTTERKIVFRPMDYIEDKLKARLKYNTPLGKILLGLMLAFPVWKK